MKDEARCRRLLLAWIALSAGCQAYNTGTETRMDEQMLDVSFENARAEALFGEIVRNTERQTHVKSRLGTSSLSLYSRGETVAVNAHCNDHIRAMDTDGDLLITECEAEQYYETLRQEGKITDS
jgi:hypothetical protein